MHRIQEKGMVKMTAKMLEIKEQGTGKYRFSAIAHTDKGPIYGLLAEDETGGLSIGVHPGNIDVEVFETKYGSMLLSRVLVDIDPRPDH